MDRLNKGYFHVPPRDPNVTDEEMQQRIALYYRAAGITCITCLGSGTVTVKHTKVTALWGKREMLYAQPCPDCAGSKVTEQQAFERRLRASGIPPSMWDWTFEQWNLQAAPKMALALSSAQRFARRPHGALVFFGNPGSGKTHLTIATALAILGSGLSVRWGEARTILDDLKGGIGDGSYQARFTAWADTPTVLVIDDYGSERVTDFTQDALESIIMFRYSRERAWMLTSNLTESEFGARLASRLHDRSQVVLLHCDSPDYRTQLQRA